MPRSTASNIVRRISLRRSGIMPKERWSPNKINSHDLKRLETTITNNHYLPLHKIATIFDSEGPVSITHQTLQKCVKIIEFNNGAAVRKPFIRDANLMKRTEWALRHYNWSMTA